MLRSPLSLFAVTVGILLAAGDSFAQGGRTAGGSSLGAAGGSSAFGSSGMGGQSAFGGSSFGQSGLGQSGFGQSGLGQSGFGQSAFGQSAFGQSAFGGGQQSGAFGGQNANQAFVGRSAADMAAFFGGAANQATQNSQRQQRSGDSRSSSSSTSNTRPEVRIAITASPELQRFVANKQPPAAVTVSNVSRALDRGGLSGVNLMSVDGVAILEGVVASPSEKLLAEKLASIEPGVRRVDNRLAIEAELEEILPAPQ